MKRLFPAIIAAVLLSSCSFHSSLTAPEEPDPYGFSDDLEDAIATYHFDQEGSLFQFTICWDDRSISSEAAAGEAPPA